MKKTFRLGLLTNIIPPYRAVFFNEIARLVQLDVLICANKELNRQWKADQKYLFRTVKLWGPGFGFFSGQDYRFVYFKVSVLLYLLFRRPDALLIGDASLTSLLAATLCRILGIRYFWWSEVPNTRVRKNMFRARKPFVRGARFVFVPCQLAKEYILAMGVEESRIKVIPNVIDNQEYLARSARLQKQIPALRRRHGLGRRDHVFLYVGQFVQRKNIDGIIEAFGRLSRRHSCARLILAGGGPLSAELKRLCLEKTGKGRVQIYDYLDFNGLCELYGLSDTLVLVGDPEAWGMVVNEAMCFGLSVLTAASVGAKDLVDSKTGLVIGRTDVESLSRAMEKLMSVSRDRDYIRRKIAKINPERVARALVRFLGDFDKTADKT